MFFTKGLILRVSGFERSEAMPLIFEVRARLARRGIRVKLLATPVSYEVFKHINLELEKTFEETASLRDVSPHEGVIHILMEAVPSAVVGQQTQRLQTTVNIHIQPVGEKQKNARACEAHLIEAPPVEQNLDLASERLPTPDFTFQVGIEPLKEEVNRLLSTLEEQQVIPQLDRDAQRDEQMLTQRLGDLGYL